MFVAACCPQSHSPSSVLNCLTAGRPTAGRPVQLQLSMHHEICAIVGLLFCHKEDSSKIAWGG
jgi:hypothetical protein